jgi:hypothetical protein
MAEEQRPAHGSALGHTIGIGGNLLLWAFGVFGWITAAIIGGILSLFAIRSLRRRRRSSNRTGGSTSSGGGSRRNPFSRGRSRSGGGSGGNRGTSARGGKGTQGGGFLRRMTQRRSTSPGQRGGLPGRGSNTGPGRGGGPLGRRTGTGRTPGGAGRQRNKTAGGGRGRGKNSPGSRQRSRNTTPGGGRGWNPFSGNSRNRNKDRDKTRPRGKNKAGSKATERRKRRWFDPRNIPLPKFEKKTKDPTGWEEAPTWSKGTTLVPESTSPAKPAAPARRAPRKPPSPRAAAAPAPGGGGGGGPFTAGAEQFAQALSKPAAPIDTLKGMDRALVDFGQAMNVVSDGVKNLRTVAEDAMPDEGVLHDQIGQYAQQMAQIAAGIELMREDQHRRNAADHERIDNHRKNELGYDFGNQE